MTKKQAPEIPPSQASFSNAQDILDHAPIGIFKTTPEGRFLYANQALAEMYGYDSPQNLVASVQNIGAELFADPKDGPAVASLLATEGIVKDYECEHIRKDGTRFWASGSIRSVYAEDGSVSHYQGFVIGITERKRAEEGLRESEEHFRTLFMDTPVSMIIQEQGNGEIIDANPMAWLQYGLSSLEELKTYEFWMEPPYSLADAQAWMRRAEQEGTQSFEWCSRKKNGDLLWEEVQSTPFVYLGRKAILVTGIDISMRKRSEEALSKSRTIMNQAEELAALGSWEWNTHTDTWLLSDNWKRIHGVSDIQQLTTSQLLPLAHPEDRSAIEEAFAKATAHGEPYDVEHRIVRLDTGEVRYVHSKGLVEMNVGGKPGTLAGAVQDITERKKAEDELKQVNLELRKSNFEKDRLFSIIAHDLRSPMSGLVRSTELLAKEPEIFSEREFRFLATEMHKNAVTTFDLLEDLLQWARMSQGGITCAPTPSSLGDIMAMGLSSSLDMARAKDITILQDVPQGLTILVDQPMFKAVIRNVLFNAIKFTHRGGEIVIRARQNEGHTVTVAVQDNGMGMSEQVLPTIFNFSRDKCHLGTEGEKGTGLGLILCKQFIEQHGGNIWVESAPGHGTTVFFTLPISD